MTASRTGVTPIHKETQSLVDRVTQVVRQSIIAGRLSPGETVSISDLANDLGVSHSPVREALQRLSGQGLVELRPARTAIVAPLTIKDLEEIYGLRRVNEVDAAVRACPLLSAQDIASLERDFDILCGASLDSEEFWRSHDEFHFGLLRPAATPRRERLVRQLWEAGERYIRVVYGETDALERYTTDERHRELLDAARGREPEAMRKALTEHLDSNERELSAVVSQILS